MKILGISVQLSPSGQRQSLLWSHAEILGKQFLQEQWSQSNEVAHVIALESACSYSSHVNWLTWWCLFRNWKVFQSIYWTKSLCLPSLDYHQQEGKGLDGNLSKISMKCSVFFKKKKKKGANGMEIQFKMTSGLDIKRRKI